MSSNERVYEGQPVVKLPDGFPAYCIYVPTGMKEDVEKSIVDKLQTWGDSMGQNLYVASWNIGDPSYRDWMKAIGFKTRPALILTDTPTPDGDSFKVVIDDPLVSRDVVALTKILPRLLDFVLVGEKKSATKAYITEKNTAKIKSLMGPVEAIVGGLKVKFSWSGVTVESK